MEIRRQCGDLDVSLPGHGAPGHGLNRSFMVVYSRSWR